MTEGPPSSDDPIVVVVDGELDASDLDWTDELRATLDAGHRRVVVDMLAVSFIDSSVVRALVSAYRVVAEEGWLRVVYTHHLIRRVITICGLADALPQYPTVEAALRGTPSGLHPDDSSPSGVLGAPSGGHTAGVENDADEGPAGPPSPQEGSQI
ncbi:anti-anti-sigma factor [Jatrophihabitans endophyticus]|uniref:Anti-sigma factor antagonist n=1 Tax=Jatrophihabitans endophyticus TaxID=1206085 RepID=A0A1M5KX24_9ACTN|nr:STAS domain-containing protein [Jatrophihabitans endophyticus]SHG57321.1 anti-anti-sigma factor [Jatrophihabitans endophyticus]